MYRLTDDEITMVHAIFSFIDDGRGSNETIESLVANLKNTNKYGYIYLEWLWMRWRFIRLVKGELPKRIQ